MMSGVVLPSLAACDFLQTVFHVTAHLCPWIILKNSTIMSRRPACIGLPDMFPPQSLLTCEPVCDRVCVCVLLMSTWAACACVCVRECETGPQQSWQCMTKRPLWTCLKGADCSNEAGRVRQSTCGWGTGGAREEAGLDVSIFLARGQGDFVSGLQDGKLGIDPVTAGH